MNTKEFAERCCVSPQIVRLWIRSGKLMRVGKSITLAAGYVLLPKAGIRKGEDGCGRTLLIKDTTGVSRRTVFNWLRSGKVMRDEDGSFYVREGLELRMTYRPVRREESGEVIEKTEKVWK